MQIGSRFTEYGLTGGFFWICQFILLWCSGQIQPLQSNVSTVQLHIAKDIPIPITSLVTALAIIAVFVTGLLLDLSAVYFRPLEMGVFRRHLVRNRDWVGRLIADHKGYCEADYEEFERLPKDMPKRSYILLFWNQEWRQRAWAVLRQARPYERLWSFFASYVLVQSGSSQLSLMVDQYYLWRTGRAVSAALLILLCEVTVLIVSRASLIVFLLVFSFSLGVTVLTMAITLGTYSRLCFTLFALVYVTQDKAQRGI
jgi:hypothetical protein